MATQTLVLQGESELRLEVDFDKIVVVTVKEGIAEVPGLELAQGKEYAFAGEGRDIHLVRRARGSRRRGRRAATPRAGAKPPNTPP